MLDRLLHHCHTVVTDGDSYRMNRPARTEEPASQPPEKPTKSGDFYLATSGDQKLAVDKRVFLLPVAPRKACSRRMSAMRGSRLSHVRVSAYRRQLLHGAVR